MPNTTTPSKTATHQILAFLKNGGDITVNQARTRFGVKNVSARISEIRKAGYPVYLNTRKTSNGRTIKVYQLGTATRRVIAAGQVVLSDPYFSALLAERIDANINSI